MSSPDDIIFDIEVTDTPDVPPPDEPEGGQNQAPEDLLP
jgi:hypothetical protein